jgi:hypothetical protein
MNKKMIISAMVCVVTIGTLLMTTQTIAKGHKGRGSGPIIFVTSQELYYDSIVTADPLPPKGPFQDLFAGGGPEGGDLHTEFGPGDPEYVGGRWRGPLPGSPDHYFSCPLLGPGREVP